MALDAFDADDDVRPSGTGGRLVKVVQFDRDGLIQREFPSKQLTDDPFNEMYGNGIIKRPPYQLEQLVLLAESHPIHASCIEQKVADIIASGLNFVPRDPDQKSDQDFGDVSDWWESLFDDYTSTESLYAMEDDHQTIGMGAFEVGRDTSGLLKRLWPVPTHTIRVHRSSRLFVQIRGGQQRWFKAWGEPNNFFMASGKPAPKNTDPNLLANELLIFKRPSRRSSWYSSPTYISALGHIMLAIAARDYNLTFFENAREPRYVYIVTGLDEATVDKTVENLTLYLRTQHKEPHRNLLLPLTGENTNVQIERLGTQQNDMHWSRMVEMVDDEVLISHRVPPDRLGLARRGFLGGTVAVVVNRIYKDGVVARGQDLIEDRLDKFLRAEWARSKNGQAGDTTKIAWRVDLEAPDISDEKLDTDIAVVLAKNNLMTLNEARTKIGMPQRDDFADLTMAEWMKDKGFGGAAGGSSTPTGSNGLGGEVPVSASIDGLGLSPWIDFSMTYRQNQEEILKRLEDLDGFTADLIGGRYDNDPVLGSGRNGHSRKALPA